MNIICCAIENEYPTSRKDFWFRYYNTIKASLGSEYLIAISDGPQPATNYSVPYCVIPFESARKSLFCKEALNVVTFKEQLPARVDGSTYPRYMRSVWAAMKLGQMFEIERVLEIETDAWIYTPRMADRISTTVTGIGCPWCPTFGFPEMMIASYHADILHAVSDFIASKPWSDWAIPQTCIFEWMIPSSFPTVFWKEMVGDRYQDKTLANRLAVPEDADFSVQDEGVTIDRWRG